MSTVRHEEDASSGGQASTKLSAIGIAPLNHESDADHNELQSSSLSMTATLEAPHVCDQGSVVGTSVGADDGKALG